MKFKTSLLSAIVCISLNAQTDDILTSISNDAEYFGKVATITKQNEKYQPYIVSVFTGDELEKVGVSNLKEALELAPGVDMATDNLNIKTPIFRGSNPSAYGQTKLFIDGVLVNNLFFDSYSEYLYMPIEMIKRVEVIRGPGSKVDGVNAYAGSINVITYAEDFKCFENNDKVVFKYGSYDYKMGGFIKHLNVGDLKIFIDFSYQRDDKSLPAGPDALSQDIFGSVNRSLSQNGDAPLWFEQYALGINASYKDFTIKAKILEHKQASAYGINFALPQKDDRVKLPNYYLELGYKKELGDIAVDVKAGIKYDTFDSKSKLAPDGVDLTSVFGVVFNDGIYGEHLAKQRTLNQSTYLKYSGFENHILTSGYRVIQEKTIDMVTKLSDITTGSAELVDYTDTRPFFNGNAKRNVYIVSLQDEYQFSNNLSFIYGFNYETTSYKDAGFEPRVSMVYQLDTNNIFKAIYSRSHRNPSWQEMFTMNNSARVGNPYLDPEIVDAFEIAYIKKFSNDSYIQGNLFYLLNKDQIYNSTDNPVYRNAVDTDIHGLEIEYKGHILPSDQIYINYSYVTGSSYIKEQDIHEDLVNVANNLAKAYYIYNINHDLSLSALAKYVGSKERKAEETREKLDAYTTLDLSAHYKNKKYNYSLLFSAKNIFNADIRYPSLPNTYVEDYTQEGRNFLITFKKEF